ncbi:hypothetical protein NEIG_01123 [Nematocida sp. ERTm5]|nr:hypothetical protein NEIG_01123 [Nematocida sp. ERTm5]
MVNEHRNNPYSRQEESFCSDTSITELMQIPNSDLFNPETINIHSDYNPYMHNQTVYNGDGFNNPTQMASSQYTSNNPLHGISSSYMKEVPSSLHTHRKRKTVKPIKNILLNGLITNMPPIIRVVRDSDVYKKFLEELDTHRLSVKYNNENHQCIAPLFYNQIVDDNVIEHVNKELIDRIYSTMKKSQNLWIALQSIKQENIKTKLAIIQEVHRCSYDLNSTFELFTVIYYPKILGNLNNYLHKNIISSYNTHIIEDLLYTENKINLEEFNPYKSTLSDIYIKNNINLLWHAESVLMSYTNIPVDCSIDLLVSTAELKRQLLFILCIPEIYEDLFYMNYEEIYMLRYLIIKNTFNRTFMCTHSMFCVIEYLHGVVHKNAAIMDESFRKIQELCKQKILLSEYTSIYHFVYTIFIYFYMYSLYLYKIDTKVLISNTDPHLQKDCNYMAKKSIQKFQKTE